MTGVGGNFESAVCRDFAGFFHLIQKPEIAFVVNQERPAAESCSSLHIFDRTHDLLLTAQAIAHTHAFGRVDRGAGIRDSSGADGKNQFNPGFFSQVCHPDYFLVCQQHDTLGLRNAMQ